MECAFSEALWSDAMSNNRNVARANGLAESLAGTQFSARPVRCRMGMPTSLQCPGFALAKAAVRRVSGDHEWTSGGAEWRSVLRIWR
jgi:hypothetical protein